LQQLARHRHISLSVKSTRWALDKHGDYYVPLELEEPDAEDWKYALDGVLADTKTLKAAYGNDVAKYLLPECVVTDLILTVNLRELRHIYRLRTGRTAMMEFQHLAKALVACLPDEEQEIVRYRSDALERAVQAYLESGSDEDRVRMEALVE
jgi:thymidylate synthase (FAD)